MKITYCKKTELANKYDRLLALGFISARECVNMRAEIFEYKN